MTIIYLFSLLFIWQHSCQGFVASTKGMSNLRWSVPHLSATGNDCVTTADVLSLDSIRSTLIRQEETIIFALIERSQFRLNPSIYVKGAFGDLGVPVGSTPTKDGTPLSFLEYMLVGTEALHSGVRRYTSPEEHAFFPDRLPKGLLLNELEYPSLLMDGAKNINFNQILLQKYIDVVVPSITNTGDDEQHGSTVISDILVLQALSRRVHYGKFVAESKYRADPETYKRLVQNNDADGVMERLTNAAVEAQVLRRARVKAATYGREPVMVPEMGTDSTSRVAAAAAAAAVVAAMEATEGKGSDNKVDPAVIENIYRNFIIPLTKDVEVAYLFRRCGKEPPPEYAPDRMSVDFQLSASRNS